MTASLEDILAQFPEELSVSVTEKDIRYGVQGSPQRCMVARAIDGSLKPLHPTVDGEVILFELDRYEVRYDLPYEVRKAIQDWDDPNRKKSLTQPFSFTAYRSVYDWGELEDRYKQVA